MKAIGSKRTTGPEAILIMVVQYWVMGTDLESRVKAHTQKSADEFQSRQEKVLSARLQSTGFPMERLVQHFWDTCKRDQVLRFAIETATLSCKSADRPAWVKEFIKSHIISVCSSMAKRNVAV